MEQQAIQYLKLPPKKFNSVQITIKKMRKKKIYWKIILQEILF